MNHGLKQRIVGATGEDSCHQAIEAVIHTKVIVNEFAGWRAEGRRHGQFVGVASVHDVAAALPGERSPRRVN